MRKLIFSPALFKEVTNIVNETDVETGVRLIGVASDAAYTVLHLIGPGKNSRHERYAYECDNEYAEERFNALLRENPELKFLGELHVHPSAFPRLSATDRRTIQEVLKEFPEFIAGVMLRNRLRLHPVHFPSGDPMEVVCKGSEDLACPIQNPQQPVV